MTLPIYLAAGIAELAGCYAFWAWLRLGKSWLWIVPGSLLLATFACLLTLVDAGGSGRVYAAYGGTYIVVALLWLWAEGVRPDIWDLTGAALCLAGSCVILWGRDML